MGQDSRLPTTLYVHFIITIIFCTYLKDVEGKTPIYVGGFFPISGHPAFASLPVTVQTAIDHINTLPGIMDDNELRMRWNWTSGDPAQALHLLHEFIHTGPPLLMTWGPMFSSVAVVVNEVAPRYNLMQVCIASSSTLKDRNRYPLTVQISIDEDLQNPAKVAFIKQMKWARVAIVFEDNEYFRQNTKELADQLRSENIQVVTTEAIGDPNSANEQLTNLKQHDARIIIASLYPDSSAPFFCQVYQHGLYGARYAWLLPGWFPDNWWLEGLQNMNCTVKQMETVIDAHFGFDGDETVRNTSLIDYGEVKPNQDHLDWLNDIHVMPDNVRDIYAYDNLITMALTLNKSIHPLQQLGRSLDQFTYEDAEMARVFVESAGKTDFVGLTGHIVVDKNGIRHSNIYIEQFRDGRMVRLETYDIYADTFYPIEPFVWLGSGPPVDGKSFQYVPVNVSSVPMITCFVLAIAGSTLAFIFLYVNISKREKRAIKISSPPINNLIIVGCFCLYASVVIYGLDTSSLSEDIFIALCFVKTGLLCVGISMAFGALFVKTYRVHAIFKKAVGQFKKIDLPDWKLITRVILLVLLDLIIILMWVLFGDVQVITQYMDPQLDTMNPEKEVYHVPTLRYCASIYDLYFNGVFYITKGALLAFGIFLAWETKNVVVAELNDSKLVGFSVYIVAVTIAIAVPTLAYQFSDDVTMHFIVLAASIILANTTVLCLVFVPKLMLLFTTHDADLHITMMSGGTGSTGLSSGSASNQHNFDGSLKYGQSTKSSTLVQLKQILEQKEEKLSQLLTILSQEKWSHRAETIC